MSTFEVVRGPEGDCLLLDDTRISGPKPWGGGTVTKTFHTDETYAVVPKDELDRLKAENAKLRKAARRMRDHIKQNCGSVWCDEYYCSEYDEDNACCVFDSYMRELGAIE